MVEAGGEMRPNSGAGLQGPTLLEIAQGTNGVSEETEVSERWCPFSGVVLDLQMEELSSSCSQHSLFGGHWSLATAWLCSPWGHL